MSTTHFFVYKKATAKRWLNDLNAEGFTTTLTDCSDKVAMNTPHRHLYRLDITHPDKNERELNAAIYEVQVKYLI